MRLLFSRRPERPGDIPLYPGARGPDVPLRLPKKWEERIPAGVRRDQLIAALLAAGRLPVAEIAFDSA